MLKCPYCKVELKYRRECKNCGAVQCATADCKYWVKTPSEYRCFHCKRVHCDMHLFPEEHRCPYLRGCKFIFKKCAYFLPWFWERYWKGINELLEKGLPKKLKIWHQRNEVFGINSWVDFKDTEFINDNKNKIYLKSAYLKKYNLLLPSGYTLYDFSLERMRLPMKTEMYFESCLVLVPGISIEFIDELYCLTIDFVVHGAVFIWFKKEDYDWQGRPFSIEAYHVGRIRIPLELLRVWGEGSMESENIRLINFTKNTVSYEVVQWDSTLLLHRRLIKFLTENGFKKILEWKCLDSEQFQFISAKLKYEAKAANKIDDTLLAEHIKDKSGISKRDAEYALKLKEIESAPRSYTEWGKILGLTRSGTFRVFKRLEASNVIETTVTGKGVEVIIKF